MTAKLGILAGGGELPARLAQACREAGRDVLIIAFQGITDPATADAAETVWVEIAKVGKVLKALKRAGAQELCAIGPVGRPDLGSMIPDFAGMKLVPKVMSALKQGDNAAVEVIVRFFEGEGFRILGAEEVLQDMLPEAGVLGRHSPSAEDEADIGHGLAVVRAIGQLDIGQAAVVRDGQVLAVEAAEGTDAMLARCAVMVGDQPGGVLVKMIKPEQDRRIDLPTIGPNTVEGARAAALNGIAIEAGGTLVVDRQAVIAALDEAGMFLVGVDAD